jgi:hypothetical protein
MIFITMSRHTIGGAVWWELHHVLLARMFCRHTRPLPQKVELGRGEDMCSAR